MGGNVLEGSCQAGSCMTSGDGRRDGLFFLSSDPGETSSPGSDSSPAVQSSLWSMPRGQVCVSPHQTSSSAGGSEDAFRILSTSLDPCGSQLLRLSIPPGCSQTCRQTCDAHKLAGLPRGSRRMSYLCLPNCFRLLSSR